MIDITAALELAREIAEHADGFHGHFYFDEEHDEDHGIGNIAEVHEFDDRLMYVPSGSDARSDDAHVIADPIEPHVGEPLAQMLNAAGPLARALLALAAECDAMRAAVEAAEKVEATCDQGRIRRAYHALRTALDSYRAKVQR